VQTHLSRVTRNGGRRPAGRPAGATLPTEGARPRHLFIVRLWHEPGRTSAEGQWRGSAEHVPSGQRRYFATFEALAHFLWQTMDEARPADGPGPGAS